MDDVKRQAEQTSGVSNVAYDLMAILTNKLEGIAAADEYLEDAQDANDGDVQNLLQQMQQRDAQDVDQLRSLLRDRL